jgi:hypothetical protein
VYITIESFVRRSRAVLNQFRAKTPVMAIKLDLIPHVSDGHNSFVRTPNRGLFFRWVQNNLCEDQ